MYRYNEELPKVLLLIPTSRGQWPAYIQRNLIIGGDTYLFMLLLIMEGGCPQFSLYNSFIKEGAI
jgi:hypothetical protein